MKQTKLLSILLTKEVNIYKANAKTAFKLCASLKLCLCCTTQPVLSCHLVLVV